jgi:surface antigen
MNRICTVLAALVVASATIPASSTAAFADPTSLSPAEQLAQLNQQLDADQAKLNELNDKVERAQSDVDQLNRKVADDRRREDELGKQLGQIARMEYEQPAFSLGSILQARSLNQLISELSQARLVLHKQSILVNQSRQLRREDEQAQNQVTIGLALIQAARDEASKVALQTQAMRNAAQDAVFQARAAALAAQARATGPARTVSIGAPNGPWPNHFTFGYCTWWVATKRYIPWFGNAIEWWANARAYGFPEGQTPQVGSIMVTRESWWGHVAYVESVSGSSFVVSEMNYTAWDVVDRRTIQLGGPTPIMGFIYGG